jgi:REP element-mobilizing transposase RayT/AraC-like DNA-binding protein
VVRPLRLLVPDGIYHVTVRGNARGPIFLDDDDRLGFLDLLARVVDRFGWVLHAYCLMTNHYHLLVQTPRPNLSTSMRQLNGVYAQRFNKRRKRVGHLFQARFGAKLVQDEGYFLGSARYVILNPVRAEIVERPEDWPWSSYRATAGLDPRPAFLTVSAILDQFSGAQDKRAAYRDYVARGIGLHGPEAIGDIYLSSAQFADAHAPNQQIEEIPRRQSHPVPPTLDQLFATDPANAPAIAFRDHGYTLKQIADHLGVHYSTISRRLKRLEDATPAPALQRSPMLQSKT